jgi:hypothetical protein
MSNILVCGRIKQGKTTLAIFLGHEHSPGVIVWDPRHMQQGFIVEPPVGDNLEEAIREKKYRDSPIIIWPGRDLESEFEEVCQVLFNPPERFAGDGKGNGGFAFVVDEAADLQTSNSINDSLRVAVKQHPRSVVVIQCTHSLQEWNRSSKDTMSALYCFRLQGRSLEYVVRYADVEDEEEFEEALKTLPEHTYVHVDFESTPGAPAFTICEPLPSQAVIAIQQGRKPKFLDERKEEIDYAPTSRTEEERERRRSRDMV